MMNQIFTLLNVRIKNNPLQQYKSSNPDNMWIVSVSPLIKQGSNNIKVMNLTAEKYPIIAPQVTLNKSVWQMQKYCYLHYFLI